MTSPGNQHCANCIGTRNRSLLVRPTVVQFITLGVYLGRAEFRVATLDDVLLRDFLNRQFVT